MQQFVVPQFIEVEDKIFGPITTRQFLIFLGSGLLIFIVYRFADFSLFVISAIVIGSIAVTFAFVRPNGQAFHYFLLNIIQTLRKPSIRIWKKSYDKKELEYLRKLGTEEAPAPAPEKPVARRARIRDLSLVVNTGGYYQPMDTDRTPAYRQGG